MKLKKFGALLLTGVIAGAVLLTFAATGLLSAFLVNPLSIYIFLFPICEIIRLFQGDIFLYILLLIRLSLLQTSPCLNSVLKLQAVYPL